MTREQILEEVRKCVCQDRQATHGAPEDSFALIAGIASVVLRGKIKEDFDAKDVALFLACLKLARISKTPEHRDNWVDLAGYAVCGASLLPELGKEEGSESATGPFKVGDKVRFEIGGFETFGTVLGLLEGDGTYKVSLNDVVFYRGAEQLKRV